MRKVRKTKFWGSILSIFCLSLVGCQERTEGCLESRATNVDVTADKACKTCCTYPKLIFKIIPRFDATDFQRTTVYTNTRNDSFKILDFRLYLSDFQFITAAQKTESITEQTILRRAADSIQRPNSFVLFEDLFSTEKTVATFLPTERAFSKLAFTLGLDTEANKTLPAKMSSTHPLSSTTMWRDSTNGYHFLRLKIAKGSQLRDTVQFDFSEKTAYELSKTTSVPIGKNFSVELKLDFKKLMQNTNLQNSNTLIQQQIKANLGQFIN